MAGAEGFEPPLAVLETAGLPLNLRPWVIPPGGGPARSHPTPILLLDFLVRLVLSAMRAELAQFQPLRGSFLVLGRGVIAILALRALKSNDLARHLIAPLDSVSTRAGRTCPKPTARPVWNAPEQLTVRKAGAVDQD